MFYRCLLFFTVRHSPPNRCERAPVYQRLDFMLSLFNPLRHFARPPTNFCIFALLSVCLSVLRWPALLRYCLFWEPATLSFVVCL